MVFCYQHVARPWLYAFGALSLLAYAWPKAWLRHLQLSARSAVYRKLRVPALNHLTQHGTLVNRLLRHRYPQYQYLPPRANLAKVLSTTYNRERFSLGDASVFLADHWLRGSPRALGLGRAAYPAQCGV